MVDVHDSDDVLRFITASTAAGASTFVGPLEVAALEMAVPVVADGVVGAGLASMSNSSGVLIFKKLLTRS